VHAGLEAVILGMHARADNPELKRAQELGLKVFSYPEYIYEQSRDKQRIVIAGSHGKTTITSMILHVLKYHNRKFDYMVGAQIEGFETMVRLSEDAPVIIIEGDEYLASPVDRRPKFLLYKHHIGLVSGIAWDHINVFPTFDEYVRQFDLFADATPKGGMLIYDETDDLVTVICRKEREDVTRVEYTTHKHKVTDGQTFLVTDGGEEVPVQVFGEHNMRNLNGARAVLARSASATGASTRPSHLQGSGPPPRSGRSEQRHHRVPRLCPRPLQTGSHHQGRQESSFPTASWWPASNCTRSAPSTRSFSSSTRALSKTPTRPWCTSTPRPLPTKSWSPSPRRTSSTPSARKTCSCLPTTWPSSSSSRASRGRAKTCS
jgi:hypothetical protein